MNNNIRSILKSEKKATKKVLFADSKLPMNLEKGYILKYVKNINIVFFYNYNVILNWCVISYNLQYYIVNIDIKILNAELPSIPKEEVPILPIKEPIKAYKGPGFSFSKMTSRLPGRLQLS